MNGLRHRCGPFALGVLFVLAAPVAARADDSLATARELYAAASYEDALAMLDRLRTPADVPDLGRTIAQYRAFCLFALGRSAGWIGHALEQVGSGGLIRPRARYVGPPPETTPRS